eukprot:15476256-Alexandrium_andersonii.AAC.1
MRRDPFATPQRRSVRGVLDLHQRAPGLLAVDVPQCWMESRGQAVQSRVIPQPSSPCPPVPATTVPRRVPVPLEQVSCSAVAPAGGRRISCCWLVGGRGSLLSPSVVLPSALKVASCVGVQHRFPVQSVCLPLPSLHPSARAGFPPAMTESVPAQAASLAATSRVGWLARE